MPNASGGTKRLVANCRNYETCEKNNVSSPCLWIVSGGSGFTKRFQESTKQNVGLVLWYAFF